MLTPIQHETCIGVGLNWGQMTSGPRDSSKFPRIPGLSNVNAAFDELGVVVCGFSIYGASRSSGPVQSVMIAVMANCICWAWF